MRRSPRSIRSELASETVAICQAGAYVSRDGREVDLSDGIPHAVNGTRLFMPESVGAPEARFPKMPTAFAVTAESTTAAVRRLHGAAGGHLACLNFASAKNPGGGFLRGTEAQEESLARSSALYPCLLTAPGYYERNRSCGTSLYLDLAIWSPEVPFFRDDDGQLLDEPYFGSVITAPAPNRGAIETNERERSKEIEPALNRRAAFVLDLAAAMGVRRLVLGAWGCGVFRNDPIQVAQMFRELLGGSAQRGEAFDEVVFAIHDRSANQAVFRAFADTFSNNLNRVNL